MKDFTGENTFLIEGKLDEISIFLNENGFTKWTKKGYYEGCNWIFADLKTKMFAPGIPGCKISEVVFNHSITLNEFKNIYEIYLTYEQECKENKILTKKLQL